MPDLPRVPITVEGSSVLHQMFRFDWEAWKKLFFFGTRQSGISGSQTLSSVRKDQASRQEINQPSFLCWDIWRPSFRSLLEILLRSSIGLNFNSAQTCIQVPKSSALLPLGG